MDCIDPAIFLLSLPLPKYGKSFPELSLSAVLGAPTPWREGGGDRKCQAASLLKLRSDKTAIPVGPEKPFEFRHFFVSFPPELLGGMERKTSEFIVSQLRPRYIRPLDFDSQNSPAGKSKAGWGELWELWELKSRD